MLAKRPVTKRPITKRPVTKRPITKRPITKRSINKRLIRKFSRTRPIIIKRRRRRAKVLTRKARRLLPPSKLHVWYQRRVLARSPWRLRAKTRVVRRASLRRPFRNAIIFRLKRRMKLLLKTWRHASSFRRRLSYNQRTLHKPNPQAELRFSKRTIKNISMKELHRLRDEIILKARGWTPSQLRNYRKRPAPSQQDIEEQQKLAQYVNWIKPDSFLIEQKAPLVIVPAANPLLLKKNLPQLPHPLHNLRLRLQRESVVYKNIISGQQGSSIKLSLQQLQRTRLLDEHVKQTNYIKSIRPNDTNTFIPRNDFFRFADGVYSSYWLGRLTNMFMRQGKKKQIINQVQFAMLLLKFKYQAAPLLILYELLEKLKPVFLLRKYKIRRTQLVEYPYVAKNSRRYMRVLQWLRRELEHDSRRDILPTPFANRLCSKLIIVRDNPRNHSLVKTRDAHNTHSNMSQFNIRYNWKRNRSW